MQVFDSIFTAEASTAKFVFCAIVAASFVVVYFWDPTKMGRNKKKRLDNGLMNHFEVESNDYSAKAETMKPKKSERRYASNGNTLQELDQYVKTLKENHINDMDKV